MAAAVVLILSSGCEAPQPARELDTPPEAIAESSSLVSLYSGGDHYSPRIRIRAPAEHPLYLENCNGAFSWGLESNVGGVWTPVWTAAINGCHSSPIVLEPGSEEDFNLELRPNSADDQLKPGLYRLAVYGLYRNHTDNHVDIVEVPHDQRLTEPFNLPAR